MQARFIEFGKIKLDGKAYDKDIVIEAGKLSQRKKKGSKVYKARYGHTPLSLDEHIPWGGELLIVGTGAHGRLPIMDEVYAEAKRRSIEIVAEPTPEACRQLTHMKDRDINAILHVTC